MLYLCLFGSVVACFSFEKYIIHKLARDSDEEARFLIGILGFWITKSIGR